MTTLYEAAQQALEALEWMSDCYVGDDDDAGECASCHERSYKPHAPDCKKNNAITALRAALKQEAEATAWLAERKNHWRKEREKAQAAKDQDPELSAALGWPGGISDPVLDRTQLLQMVAVLRVSAQQALEALEYAQQDREYPSTTRQTITALRAALAHEQAELKPLPCPTPKTCREHCCGGWCGPRAALALEQADPCPNCASLEAQNTELDRKLAEMEQAEPLNLSDRAVQRRLAAQWGYVPAQAEPTQEPVAWLQPKTVDAHSRPDLGYETCSKDDYGAFPVHTAPPRRTMVPLTAQQLDGVIERHVGGSEITDDVYASMEQFARAIEKASWEKNHG